MGRAFTRQWDNRERPGTEELNGGAERFEGAMMRARAVVAGKRFIGNERGDGGGGRLMLGNAAQRLSQNVPLPVRGTTELLVPEEPKRTDFFTAIQTGQAALSSTQIYRRRDVTNVVSGIIMEHCSAQINHRFC